MKGTCERHLIGGIKPNLTKHLLHVISARTELLNSHKQL